MCLCWVFVVALGLSLVLSGAALPCSAWASLVAKLRLWRIRASVVVACGPWIAGLVVTAHRRSYSPPSSFLKGILEA